MSKILPNVRTLIVDDVRAPREVLRRLLAELGIKQVTEASGGREALYKLGISCEQSETFNRKFGRVEEHEPFNLIISDFHLPDLSGIDLLKQVRQDSKLATVPFVMITSEVNQEEFQASKKAGVSGYILKPFSLERVREILQTTLNKIGN